MLEYWMNTGIGVVAIGGVGYLLRFLVERSHARDMEELRKGYQQELAEFTHRFNVLEAKAQVTYSALHIERGHVIKHLFQEFSMLGIELQNLLVMSINGFSQEEIAAESMALKKRGSDLVDYITVHRIFFTEDQETLLQTAIDDFGDAILKLTGPHDPNDTELKGFNEIITKRTGPTMAMLKREFRKILGVE